MVHGESRVGGGVPYHTGRLALQILLACVKYEASNNSIFFSNSGMLISVSLVLAVLGVVMPIAVVAVLDSGTNPISMLLIK